MVLDPLYRPILRAALSLTTRHKTLWLLGFLAAFLGLGGEYEFIFSQFNNVSSGEWNGLNSFLQFAGASSQDVVTALAAVAKDLSVGAILGLAIFLGFLFILGALVIISQGALVAGIAQASQAGRVKLSAALYTGYISFWSLLAIIISTRLLAVFVLAVVGLPLISLFLLLDESFASPGAALIFFILGLPLFILFSLVAKFALAYRVVEGERWRSALTKAFVLFADHWLVTIELALIVFIINILTALAFIFVAALLSIPFILLGIVMADLSYVIVLKLLITAALVLFLFILLVLGSALSCFQNSVWTLLFLKIKDKPRAAKLLRLVHGWREKYS